jgi:CubicO group peptidase (beta-lactamase class C family)
MKLPPIRVIRAIRGRTFLLLLAAALLALSSRPSTAADFEWQTATPASQGLSQEKLDALRAGIEKTSKALLVIRNDRIVYEWYAPDHSATKTHYTASMAKAIVGGLATAVAITDGKLSLDDKAAKYIK